MEICSSPPPVPASSSICWCCMNMEREEVVQFHEFVKKNAHIMTLNDMVIQFVEAYPGSDSMDKILLHFQRHVLYPSIHISSIMRNLIVLSENINQVMISHDETDGTPLIDTRSVQMYLKVVNELIQVYKNADMKKMLFADSEGS